MLKQATKQFGSATLTTTKFTAMRGLTLMGKILKAVPAGADQAAGLSSAILADQALVLEVLSGTYAVHQAPGATEPRRYDLGRADHVDLIFDDARQLAEAVGWVVSVNFAADFTSGGSRAASESPQPAA